jgi:hypothetical protein
MNTKTKLHHYGNVNPSPNHGTGNLYDNWSLLYDKQIVYQTYLMEIKPIYHNDRYPKSTCKIDIQKI